MIQTYHSAYPGSMFPDREHENPAEGNPSYVKYADYDALCRRCAELEAALTEAIKWIESAADILDRFIQERYGR